MKYELQKRKEGEKRKNIRKLKKREEKKRNSRSE